MSSMAANMVRLSAGGHVVYAAQIKQRSTKSKTLPRLLNSSLLMTWRARGPVLLTLAMRKHHLVAIRVSYHDHADVLAPHNRFRFNARLLSCLMRSSRPQSRRESPKDARLAACFFVDLQPASCFEIAFQPTPSWVEYQAPVHAASCSSGCLPQCLGPQ
jgi:hypothetical protein